MSDKMLPPLPKLRPRPGFHMPNLNIFSNSTRNVSTTDVITPPPKKRKLENLPITMPIEDSNFAKEAVEIIDEDSKTSRLLTKSECGRGGGRKRSSGSTIHSIPKFTQVVPKGGKISEVQKVLQSRLLSKQLSRQMPSCSGTNSVHDVSSSSSSAFNASINSSTVSITTTIAKSPPTSNHSSNKEEFPAASMLQSIVSLHERVSKAKILTPKPLPIMKLSATRLESTGNIGSRRRVRKPDKSSICHLAPEEPEVIIHEDSEFSHESLEQILGISRCTSQSESDDTEEKPEVTITPSVSTNSILKPEDYSKFGMPSGYIFWPTANVFVHPTVLKQENSPGRTSQNKSQIPSNSSVVADTMQSLSSVMRVRPQKLTVNNTSIDEQKRHENTNSASEVSICKFKFTGGAKPTLEEKKMMSVDSSGNFHYYSGDNSVHKEKMSKEMMTANASHIVTDRFTSLTSDKSGNNKKLNNVKQL